MNQVERERYVSNPDNVFVGKKHTYGTLRVKFNGEYTSCHNQECGKGMVVNQRYGESRNNEYEPRYEQPVLPMAILNIGNKQNDTSGKNFPDSRNR